MRFDFHPDALDEYADAAKYYAGVKDRLGLRFVDVVEEAIERIVKHPEAFQMIDEDIRRCLTRTFPYGIIFTIEPGCILIVAVAHCSREPFYWKGRIG